MKILIIGVSVLFLSGCALFEPRVKLRTETVEVLRPILYCPAPNWEELQSPELAITQITQETSDGEVAKRYKATVEQQRNHINLLLKTLEKYDTTNAAYQELEEEFKKQLEMGNFDINTEEPKPTE